MSGDKLECPILMHKLLRVYLGVNETKVGSILPLKTFFLYKNVLITLKKVINAMAII